MTRKEAFAQIQALGCTARYSEGEYRVSINPMDISRVLGCSYREALAHNEAIACYDSDAESAVGNAAAMRKALDAQAAESAAPARRVGTIDMTPTWRGVLPLLLAALEDGTETGKAMAREEFKRMADAADLWNKESGK